MADPEVDETRRQWHKRFAVDANNRAWALSELPTLTEDEQREMLVAAHASAYHWSVIGTPTHHARADLLLGRVYALLGHGGPAQQFASRALAGISASQPEMWELAFAHAVQANAAAIAGDASTHADHYARASRLGEQLDGEDRDIFLKTFSLIPVP
ncbi:MAG: hypothetical protein ABL986_10950 [Vicinamibacterales bacterium]